MSTDSMFTTAQRTQAKLRLAIDGPSGSGKTYSALLIARGLASDWSKIALIDTERGSGSLYADLGPYCILDFEPPYSVDRYVKAINAAAAEGFEVIVVDSLTHAWSGEGGILDYVDSVAKAQTHGNSFAAWKQGTPLQKRLVDSMLASPCHVIATMRTKTEYIIEENERGKKVPRKVGMAPEQRKDLEYEMTIVLDLSREHIAQASKDRTGLWDERLAVPEVKHGEELAAWLGSAAPEPPKPQTIRDEQAETPHAAPEGEPTNGHITRTQAERLHGMLAAKGRESAWFLSTLQSKKGIGDGQHLTSIPAAEFDGLLRIIKQFKDPEPIAAVEPQGAVSEPPTPKAATEATEPETAPDEALDAADQAFLDATAGNGKQQHDPWGTVHKEGTVTKDPGLLKTVAIRCHDLEAFGIEEEQWRQLMWDTEQVTSRKELSKAAASRVLAVMTKWATGLESGTIRAGEAVPR